MKTDQILKKASNHLVGMSKEELIQRTQDAGVVIPDELSIRDMLEYFVFDLHGCFLEITNSKSRWVSEEVLKRKSITVKDNTKSRSIAALSFYNNPYFRVSEKKSYGKKVGFSV